MKWRDLLGNIRANFRCVQNYSMDSGDRYCFKPKLQWNPQVKDYFIKAYGAEHFDRICEVLTHPSCYSCIRVNALKSTSDAVIQKLMAFLHEKKSKSVIDCKNRSIGTRELGTNTKQGSSSEESNFNLLSDLCSGTALELPGDGDAPSVSLQCPPIYKLQVPGIDYVVIVKGSGPHTIDYCAGPSQPPKELIVSRKCAEAVLRGAQVYVPGVMACSSHVDEGNTVAVSVAVEQPCLGGGWGVGITRGTVLQGLQTDPHYFERHGLYIGQGKARMSRAGIFRASEGIAVDMTNRVFQLPSFYGILEGEIFLQNLPSIITAHVLDPQQGERILDMCAAPGGKTTAIAILMKDRGEIIAVDRSHNKVMDIHKLAAEMGLTCITAYKLDALKSVCRKDESCDIDLPNCTEKTFDISCNSFSTSSILKTDIATSNGELHGVDLKHEDTVSSKKENRSMYQSQVDARKNIRRRNGPGRNHCMGGRVEKSRGFSPNTFDRVLLDAPCSALGLRPRLFAGEETLDSLRNHGKYQRKMFDQAVQLVRPGGVIVYSTCTINPGENEALVRYALDTYKFLSLAPQHPRIGGPGLVGRCELFGGKYVEEWLREGEEELVQRFDPSSPLDTIGFFIAKFSVGQKET